MSSTIVIDIRVHAFERDTQTTIYVVYENTYESNVYPHTPRWGCSVVGTYEQVMAWAVLSAYYCDDGGLRGPRGSITPSYYLGKLLTAMQQPLRQLPVEVELTYGENFSSLFGPSKIDFARAVFVKHNREQDFNSIVSGKPLLLNFQELDLLLDLFSFNPEFGNLSAWRLFSSIHDHTGPAPELALSEKGKSQKPLSNWSLEKATDNQYLLKVENGPWRILRSSTVVREFFTTELLAQILIEPGAYKRVLKDFNSFFKSAKFVEDDVCISIDPAQLTHSWEINALQMFCKVIGNNEEDGPLTKPIKFTGANLKSPESTWRLPDLEVVITSDSSIATQYQSTPQFQCDLFAA